MTKDNTKPSLGSIEKSFRIIELLKREGACGVTRVAEELDLPKSTAHSHLSTLEELSYVVNEGSQYEVGLRFMSLGQHARYKRPEYELVESKVEMLAERTGERSLFIVEEHGYGIYLHVALGTNAVDIGGELGDRRRNFHCSSSGKAILAYLPEPRRTALLDEISLTSKTEHTITTREELEDELERIRKQGYALNREELLLGLQGVAVPVMYPNGMVVGSLCISGPTHRMQGERLEEELPNLLLGVANEIELNMGRSLRNSV